MIVTFDKKFNSILNKRQQEVYGMLLLSLTRYNHIASISDKLTIRKLWKKLHIDEKKFFFSLVLSDTEYAMDKIDDMDSKAYNEFRRIAITLCKKSENKTHLQGDSPLWMFSYSKGGLFSYMTEERAMAFITPEDAHLLELWSEILFDSIPEEYEGDCEEYLCSLDRLRERTSFYRGRHGKAIYESDISPLFDFFKDLEEYVLQAKAQQARNEGTEELYFRNLEGNYSLTYLNFRDLKDRFSRVIKNVLLV